MSVFADSASLLYVASMVEVSVGWECSRRRQEGGGKGDAPFTELDGAGGET